MTPISKLLELKMLNNFYFISIFDKSIELKILHLLLNSFETSQNQIPKLDNISNNILDDNIYQASKSKYDLLNINIKIIKDLLYKLEFI